MLHSRLEQVRQRIFPDRVGREVTAGRTYRIVIRGDDDMVNMSAFGHFELYTGGLGGRSGEFNRVNIAELKILAL